MPTKQETSLAVTATAVAARAKLAEAKAREVRKLLRATTRNGP